MRGVEEVIVMNIRLATLNDVDAIRQLFYETVTSINTADYNAAQIAAWSAGRDNTERWETRVREQHFYIAEREDVMAGFASIDNTGYLDVLFVGKHFQRQGVAKLLLNQIEQTARKLGVDTITSDVSITARPFFERHGFVVVQRQEVEVRGVVLINFKMSKG